MHCRYESSKCFLSVIQKSFCSWSLVLHSSNLFFQRLPSHPGNEGKTACPAPNIVLSRSIWKIGCEPRVYQGAPVTALSVGPASFSFVVGAAAAERHGAAAARRQTQRRRPRARRSAARGHRADALEPDDDLAAETHRYVAPTQAQIARGSARRGFFFLTNCSMICVSLQFCKSLFFHPSGRETSWFAKLQIRQ